MQPLENTYQTAKVDLRISKATSLLDCGTMCEAPLTVMNIKPV